MYMCTYKLHVSLGFTIKVSKRAFVKFIKIYNGLSVTCTFVPLIFTALLHVHLINAAYLYQVMMTLHFLNDAVNDIESNYVARLKSKPMGKLIKCK